MSDQPVAETSEPIEPLPDGVVGGLRAGSAYPDDASAAEGVREIQTHISHVYLTRDRVYKLRKAVDLGFVHFGTRALRNADCEREVALNRRYAPDVYLGLAPVLVTAGGARLGPLREGLESPVAAREHCVVMRRQPDCRDALSLLERGALRGRHVDALARRVAAVHEAHRLGTPAPFDAREWRARVTGPVEGNFAALERAAGRIVPAARLERLERAARGFAAERWDRCEARRVAGRAVDGHGDLHLQHVWFERDDAPPVVIDCVEFREYFRRIDAASDIAFLAMDLGYRGRAAFAERALRVYAGATDDFDLYGVVDYYRSYRAAVRAKVAALAADDPDIPSAQRAAAVQSARRHLAFAERALRRPQRGPVILVCGAVGSGKSTAAELIADALRGAVVASDRVRKRMSGVAPTERVDPAAQRELYSPERSARVYAGLLERALPVLRSGRPAVLDATYSRAAGRERVRAWAERVGVPVLLVEVRCSDAVALERLERRRQQNRDPSDAGPELRGRSIDEFEPIGAWPGPSLVVHTDETGWRGRLRRAPELRALR